MTDDRTLGEILHEAREAGNDGRDRPMFPQPWADRDPRLRALDEAMAAAVGAAVMERLYATPGGELVRQVWVYWALEQPDVAGHPGWLKSWAELDERDREVDDRIYSACAVKAVHDAGLRNERLELEAAALHAHRPAILGALRATLANAPYEALAKRYRAALAALGGGDEKGEP